MERTIIYDEDCECYVWWHDGSGMCLAADNETEAREEVEGLVAVGSYPENAMLVEGEAEGVEYYDDSLFDDADALASAGFGTDEDYGIHTSDEL